MLVSPGLDWSWEVDGDLCFNSVPLPSDDIWKKFDLPDVSVSDWWGQSSDSRDDYAELEANIEELIGYCSTTGKETSSFWSNIDPTHGKEISEIRHHDCMWAGLCRNKEHSRTSQEGVNASCSMKPDLSTGRPTAMCSKNVRTVKSSVNCSSASLLISNNNSVSKSSNNSSSLLSRTRVNSVKRTLDHSPVGNRCKRQSLESDGDSPRPETPLSLSESEDEYNDPPLFKHSLGVVIRSSVAICDSSPSDFFPSAIGPTSDDDDDCTNSMAVSVSEVTGQVCRSVEKPQVVVKTEKTDAFYSDHSYHLSKSSVKMENLGVQTPSDSEEEIDVVSVGEKQSGSRGGPNGTTLPTNPSARDRQQLQMTVASAISAASRQPPNAIPMRISIGDRTMSVRTVSADSLSSAVSKSKRMSRGSSRGVRRIKHPHHRLQHHRKPRRGSSRSTSDSEPDSCEKRSLHNDMERQRRIDLRNLVENLRELVPAVGNNKRAAKVQILREATAYCHLLLKESVLKEAKKASEKKRQEWLFRRVSQLRRHFAAQR